MELCGVGTKTTGVFGFQGVRVRHQAQSSMDEAPVIKVKSDRRRRCDSEDSQNRH